MCESFFFFVRDFFFLLLAVFSLIDLLCILFLSSLPTSPNHKLRLFFFSSPCLIGASKAVKTTSAPVKCVQPNSRYYFFFFYICLLKVIDLFFPLRTYIYIEREKEKKRPCCKGTKRLAQPLLCSEALLRIIEKKNGKGRTR